MRARFDGLRHRRQNAWPNKLPQHLGGGGQIGGDVQGRGDTAFGHTPHSTLIATIHPEPPMGWMPIDRHPKYTIPLPIARPLPIITAAELIAPRPLTVGRRDPIIGPTAFGRAGDSEGGGDNRGYGHRALRTGRTKENDRDDHRKAGPHYSTLAKSPKLSGTSSHAAQVIFKLQPPRPSET
jgi:hypothetical protein